MCSCPSGAKVISLARIDLAAASAIAIFANMSLSRDGLAVKNDVSIPVGAPDMATYVASVLQGGTDGVLVGLAGQDATNFIIALKQANPDVPISATTTDFAGVIEALGPAANGIYVTSFFNNETTDPDGFGKYQAAMDAAGFKDITGFRSNSYSAVQVVAKVLEPLTDKTAAALYAALPTVTGLKVDLLPPLQFTTPAGAIPRVFNVCGFYQQLNDGEFSDTDRRLHRHVHRQALLNCKSSRHMDVVRFALLGVGAGSVYGYGAGPRPRLPRIRRLELRAGRHGHGRRVHVLRLARRTACRPVSRSLSSVAPGVAIGVATHLLIMRPLRQRAGDLPADRNARVVRCCSRRARALG